ncbi:hypothetical protein NCPPB940_05690 [Xanthomonas hortorum pv. taraxaci]|nr:hypothetical protein NCPPB940_05690 [Xanthomonas hortorum pv. taraxaci]CAD0304650.1 hypothetical protein NCPPB940_05690 [Xanthomonas hortorum pv. taraxaci]
MQLTLSDAEGLGKRKQTRREIFLSEMERIVPWKQLLVLIEPHYPVLGRSGRQPYALSTMLRIHLLQQWSALSDPAMEEALHEIPTPRGAAELRGCIFHCRQGLHDSSHWQQEERWEHFKVSVRARWSIRSA